MRGRGYAKDMRGVYIGYISYEQLNTYEHDKMSGHKKIPRGFRRILVIRRVVGINLTTVCGIVELHA